MAVVDVYCDSGQDSTKFYCNGSLMKIRSLVDKADEKISPKAHVVENFHNVNYVVGDDKLSTNKNFNISKADMVHKVCTYTMIHKMVNSGDHVRLVIGTPIRLYMNKDHRTEYEELMHDKEVEFKVDGVKKKFYIDSVTILPESIGYIYNNVEEFTDKVVGVVDIGSLNVNAAIYSELYPIKDSEISLNLGASVLKTTIKDTLNEKFVTNIQEYQIEHLLKNGIDHPRWSEMDQVIQDILFKYVTDILVELKKRNWDIDTMEIHFTGGGVYLLKEILELVGNFKVSKNPVFDNVVGFAALGGMAR